MVTRARATLAARIAVVVGGTRAEPAAAELGRIAAVRGVAVELLDLAAAAAAPVGAVALILDEAPDAAAAAALAPLCRAAAENRRPVVVLAAFDHSSRVRYRDDRSRGRVAEERAAALAFLRAHGAAIVEDPDAWLETLVLLAGHGVPSGGRVAVVAPPGGWLHLQVIALNVEEESRGGARVPLAAPDEALPAEVALVDGSAGVPAAERVGRALVIPVVARAELLPEEGRPALVGLRPALAAVGVAGRLAARLAGGLGAAPVAEGRRLRADRVRAEKAFRGAGVLGDHECKLLLSAYGVPVTRQGVATTPSAATRFAQTLGWPVEIKPWAPEATGEREGGPLATGLANPPDVRRAVAKVTSDAGLPAGAPVIVRATPLSGRAVAARVERIGALGWTVLLDVPGASRPLAAPAPLRRADADELAAALEASRAGDLPPDRAALADLLLRASFAIVDHEAELDSLELGRIVVGPRGAGAIVVDARGRVRAGRGQ